MRCYLKRSVSTAAAIVMTAIMVVPARWTAAALVSVYTDGFETGYSTGGIAESEADKSVSNGWWVRFPPETAGSFYVVVEDSGLDDGSGNVLKIGQASLDNGGSGNHQRILNHFADYGTKEQPKYDGVFRYSFRVLLPTDVKNEAAGDDVFFNAPGKIAGDIPIELVDIDGGGEMLSFTLQPSSTAGKVNFKHIHGNNPKLNGANEGGVVNGNTLNMGEWITVDTEVNTHTGKYRFSAADETGNRIAPAEWYWLRSRGEGRPGIGVPRGIQIETWRNANNLLAYFDDVKLEAVALFSDSAAVRAEAEKVALCGSTESTLTDVASDFSLPDTVGEYGAAVTWNSSNPDAVRIDGGTAVITPSDTAAKTADLTATVTLGRYSAVKTFRVTLAQVGADAAKLKAVYDNLHFRDIGGDNLMAKAVEKDLNLPSSIGGVAVTWTSGNPAVITNSGAVTRDNSDHWVTLAATLSIGSEAPKTKEIPVRVIKKGTVVIADDFDYADFPTTEGSTDKTAPFGSYGWNSANNDTNAGNSVIRLQDAVAKSGKAVELKRTAKTGTGNHELQYDFRNKIDAAKNKLIVEASIMNTGKNSRFAIRMDGGERVASQIEFEFDYARNYVFGPRRPANTPSYYNAGNQTWMSEYPIYVMSTKMPAMGEWFELRVEADLPNQTYDLYVNNLKINHEKLTFRWVNQAANGAAHSSEGKDIRKISFFTFRGEGFNAGEWFAGYIDDVIVRTEEVGYQLTNPVYSGSYPGLPDVTAFGPVNGGRLVSIDMAKVASDAPAAKLFVAAYDADGKLMAITMADTAEGTVPLNMEIPTIGDGSNPLNSPYIRAYVWSAAGFTPQGCVFDSRAYNSVHNSFYPNVAPSV